MSFGEEEAEAYDKLQAEVSRLTMECEELRAKNAKLEECVEGVMGAEQAREEGARSAFELCYPPNAVTMVEQMMENWRTQQARRGENT